VYNWLYRQYASIEDGTRPLKKWVKIPPAFFICNFVDCGVYSLVMTVELMDTYQLKRPKAVVCWNCSGTHEMLGGGMIKTECTVCTDGFIYPEKEKEVSDVKIDKRSKEYKIALKELIDIGLSKEEAENKLVGE